MTHWTEELFDNKAEQFATFLERRESQADEEVVALLDLLETTRDADPDRVLDVACGIGRHALAFGRRGYRTTGLDISTEFVERARERADKQDTAAEVDFLVGDMRSIDDLEGSYDLVTVFWNSLGYYDKETDVGVLGGIRNLLAPGGVLAIETSNKAYVLDNFEESGVRELEERLHVTRQTYDPTTGRLETRIDVFSTTGSGYEYVDTLEFRPRMYAPVELREMCERAGFDRVSLYGGFGGGDLTIESKRTVVLADEGRQSSGGGLTGGDR